MANMIVCFKIVPDYEEIPVSDWQKGQLPDTVYCKKVYNCFDEAALEMALQLKDALIAAGAEASACAVTVGAGQPALLTGLYAAGFDKVVCIGGGSCEMGPRDIGRVLAEYIRQGRADLILTGRQAGGWDSGTVPAYLAAGLSLPWVPEVTRLRLGQGSPLKVLADCEGENAWESIQIHAPAVLSVGNAEISYLRMFSLKARLEAKKKEVISWAPSGGLDASPDREYFSNNMQKTCAMLEGTASDKAEALWRLVQEGGDRR